MKLLSIFTGKPIEVYQEGKSISTGIFKHKVHGPIKVAKNNLEGDGQADLSVHGGVDKAVYAYPSEHYEFWKKERTDLQFEPGIFGENLSTVGLDEASTCVGDVFKIGSVILSVTSPRMPCFKLGIRMADERFVRDFMKAKKNGFYLKVIEEGLMEAGDPIEKLSSDGHGLTVAEAIELYASSKSDHSLLQRAISSPSLPIDWIEVFKDKLSSLPSSDNNI